MVSAENDSQSNSKPFPLPRSSHATTTISSKTIGRSMRTIRSNFFRDDDHTRSFTTAPSSAAAAVAQTSSFIFENLTDSVVDFNLCELASRNNKSVKSSLIEEDLHELSRSFSDFSACSSDISGELQRLARVPPSESVHNNGDADVDRVQQQEPEPCLGFLQRESFSTEIIESISPEDLLPTVKICIDGLQSLFVAVKRSAAAKLRLLAKNRADNRVLIGESVHKILTRAVPALVPLLRCSDPWTQEHTVTALLNLSLHEDNKTLITNAGAVKSLIYVLKTGTETTKQNAACALLSLALVEENKSSIGACGAIPPLVSLLLSDSNWGKKGVLTTLYKLCSVRQNKERAVNAGAVRSLEELVAEQGTGMAEKAMVVLNSLAEIQEGKDTIVEEGGIGVLVEAIEDGSLKGKEFGVLTLVQLCADNVRNRGLLVREGAIPPLVALSQTGSVRTKNKAETLLGYLRESRHEASSSSP